MVYNPRHNTLFTRISHQYIRRYSNHKLRNASLFGQNIVFDFKIDSQLNQLNCTSKLRQLVKSFSVNRNQFREPFNLHFCNLDYNSIIWKTMQKNMNQYSLIPYFFCLQ